MSIGKNLGKYALKTAVAFNGNFRRFSMFSKITKLTLLFVFCITLPQGAFALSGSRIHIDPTPTPTPPCVSIDDGSGDVEDEEACRACEDKCEEELKQCEDFAKPCTCYDKQGGKSNCQGIIEYLCGQDSYKCHDKCWGEVG